MKTKKIKWSPVVSREKIRRLYEGEGRGLLDTELLEDVGISLLLRCESILMVSTSRVRCPECGTEFHLESETLRRNRDDRYFCLGEDCSWEITWGEYHSSWTKRRLYGGKALSAFRCYVKAYPQADTPARKMIAVDQLLHAFHWDLQAAAPNRLAADNLIDGNHSQVLQLLDDLSGASDSQDEKWHETMKVMKRRRSGKG